MAIRRSRPSLVKSLAGAWEAYYPSNTYLKRIEICEGQPLRGIKRASLDFSFPVSVICGCNGAGKTTFLALSVLAFHAQRPPIYSPKGSEYYEFKDFFVPISSDLQPSGVKIRWTYTDGKVDELTKGKQRWMRYIRNNKRPRRPERGTEYIGISRITPAFEKKNYASYFSRRQGLSRVDASDVSEYLSRILCKTYTALTELEFRNSVGSHRSRIYNDRHTSFNAGAGEECLVQILRALISCPRGSIVAIEEIEIGLHPSTFRELIDCVLEIADERKLQIVISSHSPDFLRSCPEQMLIFAERSDEDVKFWPSPNVEYAIGRLGGSVRPPVQIVCEDNRAKQIIESFLPKKLRTIAPVTGFGGKDQLIDRANIIRLYDNRVKPIIIWDGDSPESLINKALVEGIIALKLPGQCEPEKFVLDAIREEDCKNFILDQFGLTEAEYTEMVQSCDSRSDTHDIYYYLKRGLGEITDDMLTTVVRKAVASKKADFKPLLDLIEKVSNMSSDEYVQFTSRQE